ncbi:hypothetical protein GCM10023095_09860 [Pseudaeromonas paramecii]|uniref:Solute-binding protein family 3/N-terminal domain-containing protein n=1 Tax=Pseudaeromonas paramecii TaxID=2138166 RepID=A0ABP8Q223_9GAMM
MLDEAPFYFTVNGTPEGCDPAFYQQLAGKGLYFDLRPYPINRLLARFDRGEAQMMLVPSPEGGVPQQPGYDYLGPVLTMQDYLVAAHGMQEVDLQFVTGLRVGQARSVCWKLCRQLATMSSETRSVRSIRQGLRLLESDRLDLLLAPDLIFESALRQENLPRERFVVRYRDPASIPFYLALSTALPEGVRQQIRTSLASMGPDSYRRLCLQSLGPLQAGKTAD